MRIWVYIDGFNLYYAIRESGCKWLNVKALVEAVMPSALLIDKVKYYTAVNAGVHLGMIVPSAIMPEARNIVINPNHKVFTDVQMTIVRPFEFDSRLYE